MNGGFRRILLILISLLVVVALVAVAAGFYLPRQSFPQTSGTLTVTGLEQPVDVYRDAYGIPQIYASTQHDLFFAQGYVTAQDRFFQMDFWRHIGAGSLAEMFGKSELKTDRFLRTLGWARVSEQEYASVDADTKAILQAYADGVNAYLADHSGPALSLEYSILGLIASSYQVAPWTPVNTLTWAKVMSWDLSGNLDAEIEYAELQKTLSKEQLVQLFPPYPSDHPVIVPTPNTSSVGIDGQIASGENSGGLAQQISPALDSLTSNLQDIQAVLGAHTSDIGSNNWVISGKRTTTGKPLLANDPHLAIQMPSIWYEVGLHCRTKSEACPYEVTGFSFAGAPGVIIGHNDRIAWGVTNVGPDTQDLYIEKINPNNPDQYEVDGKWVDMQIVKETLKAAGGSSEELTVRYTRHGPIISDTYGSLEDFGSKAGISLPQQPYALALRWTALDKNELFRAIVLIDRAQNWNDFREGAKYFTTPAQNLVYADVDGNIGYQMPGNVPIRKNGDGRQPVPGWTDDYEWTGYIPFDKLPFAFNPPQGFIATANNAVVGPDYPYPISTDWDAGFRAKRITDMILNAPGPIDIAYIQKIQGDDLNQIAQTLVPILLQIKLDDPRLQSARAILQNWDDQDRMDSAPAALFNVFWKNLLADTFDDNLPQDYAPTGGANWFETVQEIANQPNSPWWDNKNTPQVETRDQIFQQALTEAVGELEKAQGNTPANWNWGKLHTATFQNQSLGVSGIGPVESIFNRGPYPVNGSSADVNNTGWDATGDYTVKSLPSMRMIVDLSSLSNSVTVHTTGESGHAYHPNYANMVDLWRNIQYHPMLWDMTQIQPASGGHLVLKP